MIQLFKTNQIISSVLLLVYLLVFYASSLIFEYPMSIQPRGIFSYLIFEWLGTGSVMRSTLIAIGLTFIEAIILIAIVNRNRINVQNNLLPGMFFCFFACALPEFLRLHPVIFANLFYLFAFQALLNASKNLKQSGSIFNAGIWIGLGSLFYFSLLVLFIWVFVGLNILRSLKFREGLMILAGIFVPYFLTATVFFWYDQLPLLLEVQFYNNIAPFQLFGRLSISAIGKLSLFAFFILFAVISINQYFNKRSSSTQRIFRVLYWGLLISGVSVLFQAEIGYAHLLLTVVPLSIFAAVTFTQMAPSIAEAIHLILLLTVLFIQYSFLFL